MKARCSPSLFALVILVLSMSMVRGQWHPAVAAGGGTYFVSPRGSDNAGAGTQESPWRSISYAVSIAVAGDTVKVMDDDNEATDDYVENVVLEKSLTIERCDETGPNPQVKAGNASEPVFRVANADGVTIRGLDIYGTDEWDRNRPVDQEETGGIVLSHSSGCTIEHSRIGWASNRRNLDGIRMYECTGCNVRQNVMSHNLRSGIWIVGGNYDTVAQNACNSNGLAGDVGPGVMNGNGIVVQADANRLAIINNTFNSNHDNGIFIFGGSNDRIVSNIVSHNGRYGLYGEMTRQHVLYLNCLVDNTLGNAYVSWTECTWQSPPETTYTYNGLTRTGIVGNYWSDYTGADDGSGGRVAGDGVGDTNLPYHIDMPFTDDYAVCDNYPLMTMFGIKADFAASRAAGVAPLEVRFTDQSLGDVSTWTWDFDGDGVVDSTAQNPSHTYDAPGAYTVSLSVSGPSGSDTRTKRSLIVVFDAMAWQTVRPDADVTVETLTGAVRLEFPAGAIGSAITVVIMKLSSDDAPPPRSGFRFGDTYFSVEGVDHLEKEVTICVKYTDADLAAAGGDADKLTLSYYDESLRKWVNVDTTVDTAAQTLTATTDHFSRWVVMAGGASGFPLWGWVVMGICGMLAVVMTSVGFGYGLARSRQVR